MKIRLFVAGKGIDKLINRIRFGTIKLDDRTKKFPICRGKFPEWINTGEIRGESRFEGSTSPLLISRLGNFGAFSGGCEKRIRIGE